MTSLVMEIQTQQLMVNRSQKRAEVVPASRLKHVTLTQDVTATHLHTRQILEHYKVWHLPSLRPQMFA